MLNNIVRERGLAHLSIEYSPGLAARADVVELCQTLHAAMLQAKIFPEAGIRVRGHEADFAIVADGLSQNDFAALTLSAGAGRTLEKLQHAGELIFAAAQEQLADVLATPHFALSLEIREINPALSWNDTPIHNRLPTRT